MIIMEFLNGGKDIAGERPLGGGRTAVAAGERGQGLAGSRGPAGACAGKDSGSRKDGGPAGYVLMAIGFVDKALIN